MQIETLFEGRPENVGSNELRVILCVYFRWLLGIRFGFSSNSHPKTYDLCFIVKTMKEPCVSYWHKSNVFTYYNV